MMLPDLTENIVEKAIVLGSEESEVAGISNSEG